VAQFCFLNGEEVRGLIRSEKPDVVLTHGPLVLIAKAVKGVPTISIVHGTYANEVRWMWRHPIFGLERTKYITSIYVTYYFDMTLYRYITKLGDVYLVAVSKNTKRARRSWRRAKQGVFDFEWR
jgi:hypothetical protein